MEVQGMQMGNQMCTVRRVVVVGHGHDRGSGNGRGSSGLHGGV